MSTQHYTTYIYLALCVCAVCMFVPYSEPNGWAD